MNRISAATRISLGLACAVVSVLFIARSVGLVPDSDAAVLAGRKALGEAVAMECCLAAQHEDLATMKVILQGVLVRNASLRSAAVCRASGSLAVEVGNHRGNWRRDGEPLSPGAQVSVPIYAGRKVWGTVEFRFTPLESSFLTRWLPNKPLRLIVFIGGGALLIFIPYLKRILTHLDPSSVVPARVRAALDTLAEGVLILDSKQRIVLANRSIADKLGVSADAIQGISAAKIPWSIPGGDGAATGLPWQQSLEEGLSPKGVMLRVPGQAQQVLTLSVNSAPILGGRGERRGALATFDDITVLEKQNLELEQMLHVLQDSRDEIQRQNKELYLLATRDPLTLCLNRRSFFEKVDTQWQASVRQASPMSFVMLDIDHFKSINDTHGHARGDDVLQQVASAVRAAARECDLVCRYGGEEFCVLLPGLTAAEAAGEAEKYRQAIAARDAGGIRVTASLGAAGTAAAEGDPHALLEQADQALYAAKRTGRDRVVRYDQMPALTTAQETPARRPTVRQEPRDHQGIAFQTVAALQCALAYRDTLTAEHSREVAEVAVAVGRDWLTPQDCYLLEVSALLHDVGKLAIPDAILLKPGGLSEAERRVMQSHARIGAEILWTTIGSRELAETVRLHHCWYGGSPFDAALPVGQDIPLLSRVLAICDAFVAMTSNRVYRTSRSCEEAFAELRRMAGQQFDPTLIERVIQAIADSDVTRRSARDNDSQRTALMIGLQLERLASALDAHEFAQLSQIAHHLASTAAGEGIDDVAKVATELEQVAASEPSLTAVVRLTAELLQLGRSAQRQYLTSADETART